MADSVAPVSRSADELLKHLQRQQLILTAEGTFDRPTREEAKRIVNAVQGAIVDDTRARRAVSELSERHRYESYIECRAVLTEPLTHVRKSTTRTKAICSLEFGHSGSHIDLKCCMIEHKFSGAAKPVQTGKCSCGKLKCEVLLVLIRCGLAGPN